MIMKMEEKKHLKYFTGSLGVKFSVYNSVMWPFPHERVAGPIGVSKWGKNFHAGVSEGERDFTSHTPMWKINLSSTNVLCISTRWYGSSPDV